MTVVGTRPEIIRLSRVMAKLDESDAIEQSTVHTGQNYDYELKEIFYEDLGIRKLEDFTSMQTISIHLHPVGHHMVCYRDRNE
jgi:UDP-N-acetyl-L-fucosamine synthase